jgi:uncharacterized coiled-coil protein SlyX
MAENLEKRVDKLEARLDQHLNVIHEFIDELRADRATLNKRFELHEAMIYELVQMNGNVLRLIDAMDAKIDRLEARLGPE